MMEQLKILLLADNAADTVVIQRLLVQEKLNPAFRLATDEETYQLALKEFNPTIILSHGLLRHFGADKAFKTARKRSPDTGFIVITGKRPDKYKAKMIKMGVDDYIRTDALKRLPTAIIVAIQRRKYQKKKRQSLYSVLNEKTIFSFACFSQDVTSYKAQKALTYKGDEPDQSSIILITDEKGIIKYVNDNFCKVSGYLTSELLDRHHRIFEPSYHPFTNTKNLRTAIVAGKIWRGECSIRKKDGTFYRAGASIIPILNNSKPIRYPGLLHRTEKEIMQQAHKVQETNKIAKDIIKAKEEERNHIAQELHDNINQILACTKLYLEAAGNKNAEIKDLLRYPTELLNTSIDEIRALCCNLVTPLRDFDLEELIRKLVTQLADNTMIKIDFSFCVSTKLLTNDLKLNIYRIVQEQLSNIAKHAAAKKVSMSVQTDLNNISVAITDDGKGFDVSKERKGTGITNMINRVQSFNGEWAIESAPGEGCSILVRIPVSH